MLELHITQTGKGFSPRAQWRMFNVERQSFGTMREVYAFLRSHYGKSKRHPMYIDKTNGATVKCGWVIGFRNADWSHAPVEHWLQQDWVEVRKSETVDLTTD